MKKLSYILFAFLVSALSACEEEHAGYYERDGLDYIRFSGEYEGQTIPEDYPVREYVSFFASQPGLTEQEAMLAFQVVGGVSDQPRKFKLERYVYEPAQGDEYLVAIEGVNYKPIDESLLVIPAGETQLQVPVTLLYDQAAASKSYVLCFRLVESEDFRIMASNTRAIIYINQYAS